MEIQWRWGRLTVRLLLSGPQLNGRDGIGVTQIDLEVRRVLHACVATVAACTEGGGGVTISHVGCWVGDRPDAALGDLFIQRHIHSGICRGQHGVK